MFILTEKKCSNCKKIKPIREFSKNKTRRDGYSHWCKECSNSYLKSYRPNNKEKIVSSFNAWKERNREKYSTQRHAYYESNKESINKKISETKKRSPKKYTVLKKKWSEANRGKVNLSSLLWKLNNPEKRLASSRNRRARIKGNGGKITEKEWRELCAQYGNKCLCCGRSDVKLTLDHVIPIALGGSHTIDNAQPLCQTCNNKKQTKVIDYR